MFVKEWSGCLCIRAILASASPELQTQELSNFEKKLLHFPENAFIMIHVVTLIAVKREVAALSGRFSVERMSS